MSFKAVTSIDLVCGGVTFIGFIVVDVQSANNEVHTIHIL